MTPIIVLISVDIRAVLEEMMAYFTLKLKMLIFGLPPQLKTERYQVLLKI